MSTQQITKGQIAASGVSAGTYGDATHTVTVTVDASGLVTAISAHAISPTAPSVVSVTANYTMTGADDVVLASGAVGGFTVTLPDATAVTPGKPFWLKRTDNNTINGITVATQGGQSIDGSALGGDLNDASGYEGLVVMSDGSQWFTMAKAF